jgi:hypothetical protein
VVVLTLMLLAKDSLAARQYNLLSRVDSLFNNAHVTLTKSHQWEPFSACKLQGSKCLQR